jgi:hypothetical protein
MEKTYSSRHVRPRYGCTRRGNYARQTRRDARRQSQRLFDNSVEVREVLQLAQPGTLALERRPQRDELGFQLLHLVRVREQTVCADHQRGTHGVGACEHEGLRLLVEAFRRGDSFVAVGFGIHEAMVDGQVVGEQFELFGVVCELVYLTEKELWSSEFGTQAYRMVERGEGDKPAVNLQALLSVG